jgi:hypothetical protein
MFGKLGFSAIMILIGHAMPLVIHSHPNGHGQNKA